MSQLFLTHFLLILAISGAVPIDAARKNVLMIIADDFRPEIGAYYDQASQLNPAMFTPNMDILASKSAVFKRAHCQYALCGPSRTSFMTSRRPDTTSVYMNNGDFRTGNPSMKTLSQMFKDNGYKTLGAGKILHRQGQDYPSSWDEPVFVPPNQGYWRKRVSNYIVSKKEMESNPLPDTEIADYANKTLQELATGDQPFFLALGFLKPHMPFLCPERLLEHYPINEVSIADNQYVPHNFPAEAWSASDEFASKEDIKKLGFKGAMNETLPVDKALEVRRSYYCTVSHVDEELGRVLHVLRDLGLDQSTLVTFSSDHGWQLGEHSQWGKHTNYDLSTWVPLMIHIPGVTNSQKEIDDIVELVDLLPTLADAARLPTVPECPKNGSVDIDLCTEGSSLLPLLKEKKDDQKRSRSFGRVYSQALRGGRGSDESYMEYSVHDGRYHFTKVVGFQDGSPDWEADMGDQLYDLVFDPDENVNVVDKTGYEDIRARLETLLYKGFRK